MAVRQDEVQLRIDFITDEGKKMAAAINQTNQYTAAINASQKAIDAANKELQKANITEAKRAELLKKVADNEAVVAANLRKIAQEGKSVEGLDLSRVVPQQLIDRAKQLEQTLRRIPSSAPEYATLRNELTQITTQLRTIRNAPTPPGGNGGIISSLLGGIGKFAPQLAAVAASWETLKTAVTGAGKKEQLSISFETFLGSAEKAKSVLADLKEFEAKTPFEAEQVNNAGRALLAFGFSTDEIIPKLRRIGDVASGTGKDFNELALIYGKAKASGLIQGEELNQLAEAGIPIYAELGKVLGVSESKIRKLGEEGKIQFSDLEKVFENLTNTGGRFAGLMERQSQSQQGLYSTLKSSFDTLLTNLGLALQPAIKDVLQGLISLTNFTSTALTPVFNVLGKSINGLTMLFKDMGSVVATVWNYFSLERMQAILANFGQLGGALSSFIGQYRAARDEAERVNKEYDARAKAESERDDRQLTPEERAAIREREAIAAKEAAEARAKEREKAEAKARAAEARAKAAFDKALAQVDAQTAAQELTAEALFITRKITEEELQIELGRIQEQGLQNRLEVFRKFGKENSTEALKAANELLAIEQYKADRRGDAAGVVQPLAARSSGGVSQTDAGIGGRLSAAEAGSDAAQAVVKQKFEALLLTETEYNLQSLELKRALMEEEIAILRSATEPQIEEIRKREQTKKDIEEQIAKERIEGQKRMEDYKKRLAELAMQTFEEGVNLSILLLGKDEEARKKHAKVIKAFETGVVATQGVVEVQKIYAKHASSFAGILLATAEAAPAILRTTAAIVRIQRQKFAGGGDTGPGYGSPDSTGHRPAGIVHANEYVVPKWMRRIPGVENTLGWMEGIRLRGYATGGLVTSNTTPTFNLSSVPTTGMAAGADQLKALQMAADTMLAAAQAIPREVRGKWVYNDFADAETIITQVQQEAQI